MKHTLVFHTIDIARKIQKLIDFKAAPISLSYSEASALLIINSTKNLSQKTISLMLNLEPASVVTLIDELENAGLVKRESANGDRRKYQITLTTKGKNKVNLIEKKSLLLNKFLLGKLKHTEAHKFFQTLDQLTSYLNDWKTINPEKNLALRGGDK